MKITEQALLIYAQLREATLNLVEKRLKQGWSKAEIAKAAGVNVTTIANLLKDVGISVKTLNKIYEACE